MRRLVRLASGLLAATVVYELNAVWIFTVRADIITHTMRFPGSLLILTLVLWIVTIVGGSIAARRLWRFQRRGLALGLLVFGAGLLLHPPLAATNSG